MLRGKSSLISGWASCIAVALAFCVDFVDGRSTTWDQIAATMGILATLLLGLSLHTRNRTIDYLRMSLKHQREHIEHLTAMMHRRKNSPLN